MPQAIYRFLLISHINNCAKFVLHPLFSAKWEGAIEYVVYTVFCWKLIVELAKLELVDIARREIYFAIFSVKGEKFADFLFFCIIFN